jgi:hypothetical protein
LHCNVHVTVNRVRNKYEIASLSGSDVNPYVIKILLDSIINTKWQPK